MTEEEIVKRVNTIRQYTDEMQEALIKLIRDTTSSSEIAFDAGASLGKISKEIDNLHESLRIYLIENP
jgi:uncharacterized coiled-coil DUF342 family protein